MEVSKASLLAHLHVSQVSYINKPISCLLGKKKKKKRSIEVRIELAPQLETVFLQVPFAQVSSFSFIPTHCHFMILIEIRLGFGAPFETLQLLVMRVCFVRFSEQGNMDYQFF